MARASATCENASLAGIFGQNPPNQGTHVALHVGDPGTTGASENANTGSYARQAVTMGTPSGGAVANTGALTFATAGSVAVTHIGFWNSVTYAGGAYAIGLALASSVTAASITIAVGAISITSS